MGQAADQPGRSPRRSTRTATTSYTAFSPHRRTRSLPGRRWRGCRRRSQGAALPDPSSRLRMACPAVSGCVVIVTRGRLMGVNDFAALRTPGVLRRMKSTAASVLRRPWGEVPQVADGLCHLDTVCRSWQTLLSEIDAVPAPPWGGPPPSPESGAASRRDPAFRPAGLQKHQGGGSSARRTRCASAWAPGRRRGGAEEVRQPLPLMDQTQAPPQRKSQGGSAHVSRVQASPPGGLQAGDGERLSASRRIVRGDCTRQVKAAGGRRLSDFPQVPPGGR